MKYSTVFLDADGTVFDFDRSEKEALALALKDCSLPCGDEIIATYHAINDACWKEFERGELAGKRLYIVRFERLIDAFGGDFLGFPPETLDRVYTERLGQSSILYPGAFEFIRTLSRHCYLCLATNGRADTQRGRLSRCEAARYFSDVVISEEIGYRKPQREFFEYAARRIGDFDKSKAVIVGDSLSSDIAGGTAFGIDTVLYDPAGLRDDDCGATYRAQSYGEIVRFITENAG